MIVTMSASYAAGGSEIGPRVAQRLGLRFVDRAIPVAVAEELGISIEDAEAVEKNASSRLWNIFARITPLSGGFAFPAPVEQVSDRQLIEGLQAQLHKTADEDDVLILGHAAAVVLADRSDALHVRLDGSPQGRVQAAMRQHGIDSDAAAEQQRGNDKIRSGYVKHFYHLDSANPTLYHLVLDTVRLGWDRAEELIIHATRGDAH